MGTGRVRASLLVAVVVGSLGRVPCARAEVALVGDEEAPVATASTKLLTPSPEAPATGTKLAGASRDAIEEVLDARARTTELRNQRLSAMQNVSDTLKNGTQAEVDEATRKLAEVNRQLAAAVADVQTANDNEALATKAAVLAAERSRYGEGGATSLDRAKSTLAGAGGLLLGAGEGIIQSGGDLLHALAHPIDTGTQIYGSVRDMLARPPPTADERAASDRKLLENERNTAVSAATAPFATLRDIGRELGHDVVGPLLAGEVIGNAARIARGGEVATAAESRVALAAGDSNGPITLAPYLGGDLYINYSAGEADRLFFYSRKVPLESDGYYNVVVHGSAREVALWRDGQWLNFNHRPLAQFIRRSPGYHGQPVRLIACDTGESEVGFAQKLANKLGVPVLAPTREVVMEPTGAFSVPNGNWILYKPPRAY